MRNTTLVAGATGDLGFRIVKALIRRNAKVVAVVRHHSDAARIELLEALGVQVIRANMKNQPQLVQACANVGCVVSAVAGLKDVIVELQSLLLDAAIAAGVPRFIPSDYSTDFTQLADGENRNFDLRKAFHKKLDTAPIAATSIMNGAFADVLAYNTPFYNRKQHTIAYWGDDPTYEVDFTTKNDTAAFTAAVALDDAAPRILRIASFKISAAQLAAKATTLHGIPYKIVPMGSLERLSLYNKTQRAANPAGENELYPAWQGSQYMHSMFSVQNEPLDNNRYPDVSWASLDEVLQKM